MTTLLTELGRYNIHRHITHIAKFFTRIFFWFFGILIYVSPVRATDVGVTTIKISNPFMCEFTVHTGTEITYGEGRYYTKNPILPITLLSEVATLYTITGDVITSPETTGYLEAMETFSTQISLSTPDGEKRVIPLFYQGPVLCVGNVFLTYLDTTGPTPPDPVIPIVVRQYTRRPDLIHFIREPSTDAGVGFDSYTFVLADNSSFNNAYTTGTDNNYRQVPISEFTHDGRRYRQIFAYDELGNMTAGDIGVFSYSIDQGGGDGPTPTPDPGTPPPETLTAIPTPISSGSSLRCSGDVIFSGDTPHPRLYLSGSTVLSGVDREGSSGPGGMRIEDISDAVVIPGTYLCSGDTLYQYVPTPSDPQPNYGGGNPSEPDDPRDPEDEPGFPTQSHTTEPSDSPIIETISPLCVKGGGGKRSCQPSDNNPGTGTFIPFNEKFIPTHQEQPSSPDTTQNPPQKQHNAAPKNTYKVPAYVLPRLMKRISSPLPLQVILVIIQTQLFACFCYDLETLRRWYRMRRNRKQNPCVELVRYEGVWYIFSHTAASCKLIQHMKVVH